MRMWKSGCSNRDHTFDVADGERAQNIRNEDRDMRVLVVDVGGRGDVEPLVGLAVRLRELGAEAQMSAPPDFSGSARARSGRPRSACSWCGRSPGAPAGTGRRRRRRDLPRLAAAMIAIQFDSLVAAAQGFDALLATGLLPAAASPRSVTEKLGIRYICAAYCPILLPSPHHAPTPFPGRPLQPEVTDNRVLWELQAQIADELIGEALNAHRASIGLPPVDDVYRFGFTERPWLAADPTLGPWQEPADLDVVQTGAWLLPKNATPGRAGGVPGCRHTAGVRRLRQHPRPERHRPGWPSRRSGRRASGCCSRGGRPGPGRRQETTAWVSAKSTSRRCLPGWPLLYTTAARYDDGGRPCRRASGRGAPDGGPAVLGRPGGRAGIGRHATADSDRRVYGAALGRPWAPRPAHGRPPWPARSSSTVRRWPRNCCSKPGHETRAPASA